jgi:DNA-binding transcriptional LysR family regulator
MIQAKGEPKASLQTISRNSVIEAARSTTEQVDIRSIRNRAAMGTNIWHRRPRGVECADVLSVVAAVESGRGVAVVGEFITAIVRDRVRFVPFVSKAHFLDIGLLYPHRGSGENIKKLVAASLASKQPLR